jgi:hypothetical protein
LNLTRMLVASLLVGPVVAGFAQVPTEKVAFPDAVKGGFGKASL